MIIIVSKCIRWNGIVFSDYLGMRCMMFSSVVVIISIVIIRCSRKVN